nr:hypothetical protein [Tanacetum cinerariifolium]
MKEKKLVKKVNFRPLLNEEKIDNFDFVLSKYAMDDVKSRYENTLVGYIVGKSIAFLSVQNYVNNTWSKFGLQKLMMSDDGVFLFNLYSNEGLEQVLQRGSWMIRKSLIILTKWSFKLSLKKGEVTCVPVWVAVPILTYSEDGLSLISTQIVSSESVLQNEVFMAILNEEGNVYTKEVIKVDAPFMAATNTATVEDYEEGFIEGVGNAHAKASFLKSNDYKNSSPSYVKSTMSAPLENTFDVFSSVEEDICGTIVQGMTQVDGDGGHNPKVCEPNGSGTQKPILSDYNKSMNEEVEKIQDKRSLWSRFKEMNEASTSKAKSSMVDLEDESDEDCWD